MAFTELTLAKYASDLVIDHDSFHFSNSNANVTPKATAFKLGTVVARPKNSAPTVAWAEVTTALAVADNEFAVLWGDQYAFKYDFIPKAIVAGKWNAVVIDRDAAFKEFYIKELYETALGAEPYALLKQLMHNQGLLVLDDVSKFTVA